jgi:hypothetical protein
LATVLARMPEVPRSLVDRLVTLCDPTDYTGAAAVLVEQALRR